MAVKSIRISRFRNLVDPSLFLSDEVNIFYGDNGSGKSSVLEAIYFLLTTKSFRENKIEILTNRHSTNGFLLFSYCHVNRADYRIGIERTPRLPGQIRINGENIKAASQLARIVPTLCLDSNSFDLLNGGPTNRRRYLDWGVFHVEHEFAKIWSDYNTSLKQRNTLLRRGKIPDELFLPWERQLALCAERIDLFRAAFVYKIEPLFEKLLKDLDFSNSGVDISFSYLRGWDESISLELLLEKNREKDRKAGFTQLGPHRADLKIRVGKFQADQVLSRGQQKLLVCAMVIAQAVFIKNEWNKDVVVILDDVVAELDNKALNKVLKILTNIGAQVILSTIEKDKALMMREFCISTHDVKLFHVEHGNISEYDATLT